MHRWIYSSLGVEHEDIAVADVAARSVEKIQPEIIHRLRSQEKTVGLLSPGYLDVDFIVNDAHVYERIFGLSLKPGAPQRTGKREGNVRRRRGGIHVGGGGQLGLPFLGLAVFLVLHEDGQLLDGALQLVDVVDRVADHRCSVRLRSKKAKTCVKLTAGKGGGGGRERTLVGLGTRSLRMSYFSLI